MQNNNLHPRPQLSRPDWTELSGVWQFAYDDDNVGLSQNWHEQPNVFDRTINVPFPPEAPASGIGDTGFHAVVWYRLTVTLETSSTPGRWLLHFGAVDYAAQVWVNGQLVAQHSGGHTPFWADISPALDLTNSEQVIVVRAEDAPTDASQPRGKQYWEAEPRRIWYHRTTGIWQPVWLERVAETFITDLRWTPDVDKGLLGLNVRLNHATTQPLTLRVQLSMEGAELADDTYTLTGVELERAINLHTSSFAMRRDKILWSPTHPNLIDATLTLSHDGQVLDTVQSYAGLRSVGFEDGRFLLNGFPYYLRLVLEQGYWPESHLAAPSADALRREVELIKELGFNGVRIHQKVEDPRFLYWCDRLGLMVWGEMANAYLFSAGAVESLVREWLEVVRRDYSHPSIVCWVPLNESWGVPNLLHDAAQRHYVQAVYHLTHALDPTRPVIGNDGWEHLATDVFGIHDYALDGPTITARYGTGAAVQETLENIQPHFRPIVLNGVVRQQQPIMLTECGGLSFAPSSGTPWWGYGTVQNEAEFENKYAELIGAILDCPTVVGFCYTQLTDTGQETNGLLHADRRPKLSIAAIKSITTRPSRAMPGEIINVLQANTELSSFESP